MILRTCQLDKAAGFPLPLLYNSSFAARTVPMLLYTLHIASMQLHSTYFGLSLVVWAVDHLDWSTYR